jgi:CHAT domain-containing protein
VRALQLFDHARERLVAEGNAIWPSLIDLYKAVVLFDESRNVEAGRAAEAARRTFDTPALATKAALADLLIARLRLRDGNIAAAEQACADALRRLESVDSPGLVFQAHVVLGQICESAGENARAMAAYARAHQVLERLRSHLAGDELKIAFLKDKLIVFESLVHLLLNGTSGDPDLKKAFKYIEQAKSRSLADLISFRAHALPAPNHGRSSLVDDVRRVREELNWYYHQIDLGQYSPGARSPEHLHALRSKAHDYECHLVELLNELRGTSDEFRSLQQGASGDLETIQASVPDGAMIVEFYEARGVIYAMLVGRRQFEIIPVTSAGRVRGLQRFLNFQLSKFRLGAGYVHRFERELHEATERHLRDLYSELIAPLRDRLAASHLIIVPHDSLHYLPFHALHDGERYLCDSYSISYAPSASVYQLCAAKAVRYENTSLVLGVPDQAAPFIDDEVRAVAKALPGCRLYVGDDVCEERLRETGRLSRFIHIAAHAYFRQDNPMFSSIRLGQSELTLFDLYRLDLAAELVVLSGCGTGRNVMAGGDEMLGLTRGLLYAGAHSLVLTLWEVCDRSTADFMKLFYAELASEAPNKAEALQRTMRRVREEYPHPYFWAPFVMVGDFQNRSVSARSRGEPLTHALSIT